MKTYARLRVRISPELKQYLDELAYEASDILREAVYKALLVLYEHNPSDVKEDLSSSHLIRADFESYLWVRSLKKKDRERFYALVNEIALPLAKEKLELRRKLREKLAQFGSPVLNVL